MLHRTAVCAFALLLFSSSVVALEVGFESQLLFNASDNVNGANRGDEDEGQVGNVQFGVFGEQKGTRLTGGFAGEIYSTRRMDDSDANFSSITQFLGAAELQITPRSFSWYVGDILGSVRNDDGFQSIDVTDDERRNVFVTGPQFVYEIDSFSRVNANLLYVNQTQDDVTLESLINTNADWSVDTDRGNTWGIALNNVFTDNPDSALEGDFNRFSLAGTWSRSQARNTYTARLGGTRFDTEDEALNGVSASFSLERQLSAQTVFSVSLSHDLRDRTLNNIQSLIDTGAGVDNRDDGVFDETRIDLNYALTSTDTTLDFYAGAGQSDFRLLSEAGEGFVSTAASLQDRTNYNAGSSLSRQLTSRIQLNAVVDFSREDFTNTSENSNSLLGETQLVFQISRSFDFQAGYRVNVSDGLRFQNGSNTPQDVDSIENRVVLGLRWAPPSRASKDLTIQLKSLLQ